MFLEGQALAVTFVVISPKADENSNFLQHRIERE
jgi:hypothetical protein